MPNASSQAAGEAMPAVNRCAFLRTTATASLAIAAASPVADPLLDLVRRYEAEERRIETLPARPDLTVDDMRLFNSLTDEMRDRTPRATTEASALAALRLAHSTMRHSRGGFERPLVGAALAFYHGRAL